MAYARFESTVQSLHADIYTEIMRTSLWRDISSKKDAFHVLHSNGSSEVDDIYIIMGSDMTASATNTYQGMHLCMASAYEPSETVGDPGVAANIHSRYTIDNALFMKYDDGYNKMHYSVTPSVAYNLRLPIEVLLVITPDYIQAIWWAKSITNTPAFSNGFYIGLIDRINPVDKTAQMFMPFAAFSSAAGVGQGSNIKDANTGRCLILADHLGTIQFLQYIAINAPKLLHVAIGAAGDLIGYSGNHDNDGKLMLYDIAVSSRPISGAINGLRGFVHGMKTFISAQTYRNGDIIVDHNDKKYMFFRQHSGVDGNMIRTFTQINDIYLIELR